MPAYCSFLDFAACGSIWQPFFAQSFPEFGVYKMCEASASHIFGVCKICGAFASQQKMQFMFLCYLRTIIVVARH